MPSVYSYKTCIQCGFSSRRKSKKYCSTKCQNKYQRNLLIESWLASEIDGRSGKAGTAEWIKIYFIEKFGEKCMRCEWAERNPFTNKIPLTLHHVDGDFKNNRPENLELICPNCHSLTGNFGSRNKGKGRPR